MSLQIRNQRCSRTWSTICFDTFLMMMYFIVALFLSWCIVNCLACTSPPLFLSARLCEDAWWLVPSEHLGELVTSFLWSLFLHEFDYANLKFIIPCFKINLGWTRCLYYGISKQAKTDASFARHLYINQAWKGQQTKPFYLISDPFIHITDIHFNEAVQMTTIIFDKPMFQDMCFPTPSYSQHWREHSCCYVNE